VFDNSGVRIFKPRKDKVTGGRRKLHEGIYNLHSLPHIVKMIKYRSTRLAGHVTCMGKIINAHKILIWKPEGKRPVGRPRHRWDDNIKMDLRGTGFEDMVWIQLAKNRDRWRALVNTVMNLRVHKMRGIS
jgi:hypothetical protein